MSRKSWLGTDVEPVSFWVRIGTRRAPIVYDEQGYNLHGLKGAYRINHLQMTWFTERETIDRARAFLTEYCEYDYEEYTRKKLRKQEWYKSATSTPKETTT